MGPANSLRISRVPSYSGVKLLYSDPFVYAAVTLSGCAFQHYSTKVFYNLLSDPITPTLPKQSRFGLFPVRSPLLRESLLFSFPMGTKMFQFPTSALYSVQ